MTCGVLEKWFSYLVTTQKEAGALRVARCRSVVLERDSLGDGRSQKESEEAWDHSGYNSISYQDDSHKVS